VTGLLADLRYALRTLAKNPGFTAVAVATLALGIGANTAIFSVVHAVLWKPLGFPNPERLVTLEERGSDGKPSLTGFPTYQDWRARAGSFEDVAVVSYWIPTLAPDGGYEPEKLEGLRVSDGFFRMLHVRPILGRDFQREEDRPNQNRVAILSYGLWKRRFGSDPTLPGRSIRIGDRSYLVAGILPPDFESVFSPFPARPAEIWSPLGYDSSLPQACRDCRHLRAFGRVKAGVSLASARTELAAVEAGVVAEHPADYASAGIFVEPLDKQLTGKARPALLTLLAAVGFVLLLGCANVASLLIARADGRRREVAIRCALGAGERRIARMFLTESLLLAAAGGLAGVATAAATLRTLVSFAPAELPRLSGARLDGTVLAFAAGVSIASGLLFGLLPALRSARLHPEPFLREGSGGSASRRSRRTSGLLVAFDTALAFVLLFGAGLLVKSTARLLALDPGFVPAGVLQMEVSISGAAYRGDDSAAALAAFYEQALTRIRSLPGVIGAGATSQLPLGGNFDGYGVHIEGRYEPNPEQAPSADRYSVTPGYLAAMRIPVLRGRGFTDADRRDAPLVVLINRTLAESEFSGGDPIGRRLRIGGTKGPLRTIVGIVGDVRHTGLDAPKTNQVYLPHSQFTDSDMVVVLRTAGDPAALAPAARAAVRGVDPNQPVTRVATVKRIVAASAASRLFAASLSTAFAGLAVLLAAVGVFGVVSAFVTRRVREIGIRIALGARRGRILGLVAGQAVALAAAGVAAATPIALGLGRALQSQLYDVSPGDAALLAAVAALAITVALAASLLPARRATRIDPMEALRSE
jgi:putative ABC transport system permease protein